MKTIICLLGACPSEALMGASREGEEVVALLVDVGATPESLERAREQAVEAGARIHEVCLAHRARVLVPSAFVPHSLETVTGEGLSWPVERDGASTYLMKLSVALSLARAECAETVVMDVPELPAGLWSVLQKAAQSAGIRLLSVADSDASERTLPVPLHRAG